MFRIATPILIFFAWLSLGSIADAGYLSVTFGELPDVASDVATSSSTSPSLPAERSPERRKNDPVLEDTFGLPASGQMGSHPSGGFSPSSNPPVALAATLLPEFSPHQIRSLVIESQSRPPKPFMTGVFRPPRIVRA